MIDKGFKGIWFIVKLNLLFVLFSFCGLIIFGVGPALQMMNDLFVDSEFDYKEITIKKAWVSFKSHFVRSNQLFWLYNGCLAILFYNLYLSVQLKGLLWLIIDFLLLTMSLLIFVSYQYVLVYESEYELPMLQLIKLSFISVFLSFSSFLKLLIGIAVILGFSWGMKGLLLFATFALWTAWNNIATKHNREFVEKRLVGNES